MDKYLKYKNKYIELKKTLNKPLNQNIMVGGTNTGVNIAQEFTPEQARQLAIEIPGNTTIVLLTISIMNNTISDMIKNILQTTRSIKTIHIYGCTINREDAVNIAQGLSINTSVNKLDFGWGNDEDDITTFNDDSLAIILNSNINITHLHFNESVFNINNLRIINQLLTRNNNLDYLGLTSARIGNEGCIELARALSNNTTLTQLGLSDCQIGNEGCIALAQTLNNTALSMLDLSNNEIGDEGCVVLAQALSNNTTLTNLDLSYNQITQIGFKQLGINLERNKGLISLNVNHNQIDFDEIDEHYVYIMQYIIKSLRINFTLTHLSILPKTINLYPELHYSLYENSQLPRKIREHYEKIAVARPLVTNSERPILGGIALPSEILDDNIFDMMLTTKERKYIEYIKRKKMLKKANIRKTQICPCGSACSGTRANPCPFGL